MSVERGGEQDRTDRYFDSQARYWREVYEREDLQGLIYRQRMASAIQWVEDAAIPPAARVLEVGSGAGFLCAELARRGFEVTATDSSPEMVELTRRHSDQEGVGERVRVQLADAHRLPFADAEFDLVVALGLLPWLHTPAGAVAELTRVLRPGGWLILTADNRARLNFLIEPRENPLLVPLKLARRAARGTRGREARGAHSYLHLPSEVGRLLAAAGLTPMWRTTVGYGPFTFLGRGLLSVPSGIRLHRGLERLAERRLPALRRLGWHYLVAARKS